MPLSLEALLRQRLKSARFEHTLGVVKTAVKLARLHGVPVKSAALAAWLHDCAKALERGQMKRLLTRAGADSRERAMPALWHACVGAWLARHEYGVKNRETLKAIRYHSTGAPGMGKLQKLLFVADYIEPGRGKWPELKKLRLLARKDLDAAYLNVLSHKIADLLAHHRPLHPRSVAAYHDALK
jgi:predicted HD superfamily hydrolase involved in NAD metabolism